MRRMFLVVACVLCAWPVAAQVHKCDEALPVNPNLTSPIKVGTCHTSLDTSGAAVTITAFRVYLDGATTPVYNGPLVPIGGPNAAGKFYYETPPIAVTRGNHAVTVSAVTADGEGAQSAPYPFGVLPAPVAAPTNTRVVK